MNYTETRKFKKVCKILDRKHQGGVSDKDIPAFINSNGNPILRKSLRAQNRNKSVNASMNCPAKALRMNLGYYKIQRFILRAFN